MSPGLRRCFLTFLREELLHRGHKLLELLQFFIANLWIGEDFSLKVKQRRVRRETTHHAEVFQANGIV